MLDNCADGNNISISGIFFPKNLTKLLLSISDNYQITNDNKS